MKNICNRVMNSSEALGGILEDWVAAWCTICPFDINNESHLPWDTEEDDGKEYLEEGVPTHVCRLVMQADGLVLVDGTQMYLVVAEDGSIESIWEDAWQYDQPDYYGGCIPDSIAWCKQLDGVMHRAYR